MSDKKRRVERLGAADPDVRAMTDAQILAEHERLVFGQAEEAPRGPYDDLTDDELLAVYEDAVARITAELGSMTDGRLHALLRRERGERTQIAGLVTAELQRREVARRPPPSEPEVPMGTTPTKPEPPIEPHVVELAEPASPTPMATPRLLTAAELQRAAVNEQGLRLIEEARLQAEAEEAEMRRMEQRDENEPMIEGSVRLGANASAELRALANGGS